MQVDNRLEQIFAKVLSPDTASALTFESTMEATDGWNSRSYVELIVEIESEFGISLSTLDAARMSSVAAIYEVLAEKGIRLKR